MIAVTGKPLCNVDVGRAGLSGNYSRMTGRLRTGLPRAILAVGLWMVVLNLPPSWDYAFSADLSLMSIFKLGLLIWTAKAWWPVLQALYFGVRWLSLEARGMQWVNRNDHILRVAYFRAADQSTQLDDTPRTQRLHEELQAAEYRKKTLINSAWRVTLMCVGYILVPLALAYADEFLSRDSQEFLARWNAVGIVRWAIFFFLLAPELVRAALALLDGFVYQTGAQFIPGAKLHDPVVQEKTIETMRDEKAHGGAEFVSPQDAARQLSR